MKPHVKRDICTTGQTAANQKQLQAKKLVENYGID
jgi:hypothetical protein